MKRIIALNLVLLLCLSLLCSCSILPDQKVTSKDLTLTLPGYFIDLSDEDYAEGMNFLYGFGNIAILGLREERETLKDYISELSLKAYAELFLESNELDVELEEKDGLMTFTYTADADGTEFTYLCALYETEEAFWVVQTYCPTSELAKNQEDMLGFLKSVEV